MDEVLVRWRCEGVVMAWFDDVVEVVVVWWWCSGLAVVVLWYRCRDNHYMTNYCWTISHQAN